MTQQDEGKTPIANANERMCPILSAALIAGAAPPRVVVPGEQVNIDVISCKGLVCAFFLPMTNDKGVVVSGGCSVTVLASILSQVNGGISQLVKLQTMKAMGQADRPSIIPA